MGEISAGLVRKLEAAGLTEAEKQVLALAIASDSSDGDVEGFAQRGLKMPGVPQLQFEIQQLMPRFNQAENVVINHEEQVR